MVYVWQTCSFIFKMQQITSRLQECLLYQIKKQIKVYLHYASIDALGRSSVKYATACDTIHGVFHF